MLEAMKRFDDRGAIIAKELENRDAARAALDAYGQEPAPAYFHYPGKRPIPDVLFRWERLQKLFGRLRQDEASNAALVGLSNVADFWMVGWLLYDMQWRSEVAAPRIVSEQGLIRAVSGKSPGKLIGGMKRLRALIEATHHEAVQVGLAYRREDPALQPLAALLKNFNEAFDGLARFNGEEEPTFCGYLGVKQEGEGLAIAKRSASAAFAVIVPALVRGEASPAQIDGWLAALAGATLREELDIRKLRRRRNVWLEKRGF
jgi:hypothetical protein